MRGRLKEQFIVDAKGRKISVVIPFHEYQRLMEHLKDIELIDERRKEPSRPFEKFDRELKEKGLV
jgi:hypothetical protein